MSRHSVGQRQTRQRDAVLEIMQKAAGPLTVGEIHERGQEVVPGLGIATVYRTLRLLQDANLVHAVVLPSGESRFEPTARGHHHHFHCRVCDRVYDLDVCPVEVPHGQLYAGGFLVEDHEVTLFGTCPGCRA